MLLTTKSFCSMVCSLFHYVNRRVIIGLWILEFFMQCKTKHSRMQVDAAMYPLQVSSAQSIIQPFLIGRYLYGCLGIAFWPYCFKGILGTLHIITKG